VPATSTFGLATTTGGSLASSTTVNMPGQASPFKPVVQAQDGTFIGTVGIGPSPGTVTQTNMIAFGGSGNVNWSVPNDSPQIATADGGVIGASGITYDSQGRSTGQTVDAGGNGWMGNLLFASSSGVLSQTDKTPSYATTFAALPLGNQSQQGTAIQQVITKQPPSGQKQLPNLNLGEVCWSAINIGSLVTPTCGNINAIELLTNQSPDSIFTTYMQKFLPVTGTNNSVMTFTGPGGAQNINVTGPGQTLTIALNGWKSSLQKPFQVLTERFDPTNHVISAVTLQGHPLAGWRYWRVYSIGTNDVVVETGAYDQPGPGILNYAGYYVAKGDLQRGWQQYLQFIQSRLHAAQGSKLGNTLGGITLRTYSGANPTLAEGYWDYAGDFTNYILNNVCQSTECN
jgi:hypothetical protein